MANKCLHTSNQNYFKLIACILIICSYCIESISSTRTRVGPSQEEPTVAQLYNAFRLVHTNPNYYYLGAADALSNQENISKYLLNYEYDQEDGNNRSSKTFSKFDFKFYSGDYILHGMVKNWYVLLEERGALHVYDDPRDELLARGPQVDQSLCGLHLDYMLHMVAKHQRHLIDSTEYSIFHIMSAFDRPHLGAALGSQIFLGDYDTCLRVPLNVIRDELIEVDKMGAEAFFESDRNLPERELTESEMFWANYVAPFFGSHAKDALKYVSMAHNGDKLRQVPMRYCMAGLRYPERMGGNSSWARRHLTFRVATCLPETCDSSSLSLYSDKIQQLTEFQMNKYHLGYHIENLYCLPDEKSPLRDPWQFEDTRLFVIFNLIWFSLLVISTLTYYWFRSRKSLAKLEGHTPASWWIYLRSWNVVRNSSDLLATSSAPSKTTNDNNVMSRVDLSPLEGLRFLSALTVISSHSIMVILTNSWNDHQTQELASRTWLVIATTVYPSTVNIFFAITGVITTRSLLQMARGYGGGGGGERQFYSATFWLKFFIYRYIRIVPLYLFLHWFIQSLFRFLGSGPLWDYGTSHSAWVHGCRQDSIWQVILPRANYYSPSVHCNGVGWYLANDLHFVLLTPIFFIPLWSRPRLGHFFAWLAVLVGVVNHVDYYLRHDPDPRGLLEWNITILTRVTDETMAGYVEPKFRFVAYVIGLSGGHLLDAYEQNRIKHWPRRPLAVAKTTLYFICYLILFLPWSSSIVLTMDDNDQLLRWISALILGSTHLLSALATVIFVLLVVTGHYPRCANLLGSRVLKPLGNMSLSTVLVHLPVMFYHTLSLRAYPHMDHYEMSKTIIVWILECLTLSAVVHVLYELPMRRFLRRLLITDLAGVSTPTDSQGSPRSPTKGPKSSSIIEKSTNTESSKEKMS